jgi:hypothetical protein
LNLALATEESSTWLARLFGDQEDASSNPVAPTFFRNEPFGENVKGLSHFSDETCAVEPAVQTDDFEDSTLCIVIGGKPLLAKRLRKLKHFGRQLGVFVV